MSFRPTQSVIRPAWNRLRCHPRTAGEGSSQWRLQGEDPSLALGMTPVGRRHDAPDDIHNPVSFRPKGILGVDAAPPRCHSDRREESSQWTLHTEDLSLALALARWMTPVLRAHRRSLTRARTTALRCRRGASRTVEVLYSHDREPSPVHRTPTKLSTLTSTCVIAIRLAQSVRKVG